MEQITKPLVGQYDGQESKKINGRMDESGSSAQILNLKV